MESQQPPTTEPAPQELTENPEEKVVDLPKIMIIMRGCPGSGKSYLAKQLLFEFFEKHTGKKIDPESKEGFKLIKNHIFSSDNYFINPRTGVYEFRQERIGHAHNWCQNGVKNAVSMGVTPIIVDNTNTQTWEAKPYVECAVDPNLPFKYEITIQEPNTPWKSDPQELVKRNTHQVPIDGIKRMLARFEPLSEFTVENIVASVIPKKAIFKPRGGGRGGRGSASHRGEKRDFLKESDE